MVVQRIDKPDLRVQLDGVTYQQHKQMPLLTSLCCSCKSLVKCNREDTSSASAQTSASKDSLSVQHNRHPLPRVGRKPQAESTAEQAPRNEAETRRNQCQEQQHANRCRMGAVVPTLPCIGCACRRTNDVERNRTYREQVSRGGHECCNAS